MGAGLLLQGQRKARPSADGHAACPLGLEEQQRRGRSSCHVKAPRSSSWTRLHQAGASRPWENKATSLGCLTGDQPFPGVLSKGVSAQAMLGLTHGGFQPSHCPPWGWQMPRVAVPGAGLGSLAWGHRKAPVGSGSHGGAKHLLMRHPRHQEETCGCSGKPSAGPGGDGRGLHEYTAPGTARPPALSPVMNCMPV